MSRENESREAREGRLASGGRTERGAQRKPTPRKRPSVKDQRGGRLSQLGGGALRSGREEGSSGTESAAGAARVPRDPRAGGRRSSEQATERADRVSRDERDAKLPVQPAQLATLASAAFDRLRHIPHLVKQLPSRGPVFIVSLIGAIVIVLAIAGAVRSCSAGGDDQQSAEQSGEATTEEETEPAFQRNEGPYSVSFATTGDIMFGREVSTFVDANGGEAALANVSDELAAADVTIANLECPLTEDESEALLGKDVLWRSNPKGIEALKLADITLVSLANNHIMDYGGAGLSDTLKALDGAGILHAGAGMTEEAAGELAELEVNGVSIAFLSWTDIIPDNFLAFDGEPGVVTARLNMKDACERVRQAKETHDVVVVAMHWGVEYQPYIDAVQQQDPGHQLVDAGADVIIGNHPHVIEGIELYKGALISYSQGDFVCDHYSQETGESFILKFDLTQDGVENISATPVYLDDTYGIPSIVTGEHAQTILDRLEQISAGMNTAFEVRDDVAYITPQA